MSYRTAEQITAQIEARKAEIEAEAQTPAYLFPCRTCKWQRQTLGSPSIPSRQLCCEPLVVGLDYPRPTDLSIPPLCGPERALWQPNWRKRLLDWFGQ